jgi:tagatose-6-phosphate ketose/aldose isomerase
MTLLKLDEGDLQRAGALWTAREIVQQPASLERTHALLAGQSAKLDAFLAPLLARADLRIILTGAGTSAFVGECLEPLLLEKLQRRVEAIPTTDLLSGPAQYFQRSVPTLLVSFGRSGSSPESLAVVQIAEQHLNECFHLVITCNETGALYEHCRDREGALAILLPPETHDRSFAMTSSFTAMVMAANLVFDAEARAGEASVTTQLVRGVLDTHNEGLVQLARESYSRVVYLGANGFKAIAKESALKLLEMTDGAIVAVSDTPLGFRHGPKTIITADTLVVVFVSNDPYTRRYDLDLLQELRSESRAGKVIAITAQADAAAVGDSILIADANAAHDTELLFPYMVCGQLYAFHRSMRIGNSPDQPSKSGTVSRVVRGVTIHSL